MKKEYKQDEERKIRKDNSEWKKEHDTHLKNLIATYGTRNWQIVVESFNSKFPGFEKTVYQCKNRWHCVIEYNSKRHPWDEADRANLLLAHKKYKNRWSEIATLLKKRSNNRIKNRFYSLFRKTINKIRRKDYFAESSIEVLETYYVISVIEDYLKERATKTEKEIEEIKDYIYRLIQNQDTQNLEAYKQAFYELHKEYGTMESLFEKISKENQIDCSEHLSKKDEAKHEEEVMKIELPENEVCPRIELPLPENFQKIVGCLSFEDKYSLWKSTFAKQESNSVCLQSVASFSSASTLLPLSSNPQAPAKSREDECKGFSQYASVFESNNNQQQEVRKADSCHFYNPVQAYPSCTLQFK